MLASLAHKMVKDWNSRHDPGETVTLDDNIVTITTSIAYLVDNETPVIHVHGGTPGYVGLKRVTQK